MVQSLNGKTFENCNVEFKSIYTVFEILDDRGTKGAKLGVFFSESQAKNVAKGKGWYGNDGSIDEKQVIVIKSNKTDITTVYSVINMQEIDISNVLSEDDFEQAQKEFNKLKGFISKDALKAVALAYTKSN